MEMTPTEIAREYIASFRAMGRPIPDYASYRPWSALVRVLATLAMEYRGQVCGNEELRACWRACAVWLRERGYGENRTPLPLEPAGLTEALVDMHSAQQTTLGDLLRAAAKRGSVKYEPDGKPELVSAETHEKWVGNRYEGQPLTLEQLAGAARHCWAGQLVVRKAPERPEATFPAVEPQPRCLRCGGAGTALFTSFECATKCAGAKVLQPSHVVEKYQKRIGDYDGHVSRTHAEPDDREAERYWRVSGHGVTGIEHPVRETAIAMWREKVRKLQSVAGAKNA